MVERERERERENERKKERKREKKKKKKKKEKRKTLCQLLTRQLSEFQVDLFTLVLFEDELSHHTAG